jgi:RNA polymerase sigma factor (sigma-70 family)
VTSTSIQGISHRALGIARAGESRVTDPPAFDELFRQLFVSDHDSIFRYLARLTGDDALAADIAQDAFIRLLQRGQMPDQPRAWLIAVAHNRLRDEQRGVMRRRRLLGDHTSELLMGDPPPSPDAAVLADERRRSVRRALDALPERDRQMLLLRYEGYSYRDLAHALQIAEASVGTLLLRAQGKFVRLYEGGAYASASH